MSTPAESTTPAAAHHGVGHVVPLRTLIAVFVALAILTWVTVAAYYYTDFGALNLTVALAIALVKAVLVALYFMHLRWDKPINAIVFVVSLTFVTLFVLFALLDSAKYGPTIEEYRKTNPVAPQLERQQVGG